MNIANKIRLNYFIGFVCIVVLLAIAEYLEIYQNIIPCPLCMLQRVILIILGLGFFIGMIFKMNKTFKIILSIYNISFCFLGILFSSRQVWLQESVKQSIGECGASLSYMLKILPLSQVIKQIWVGGMGCSEQGWVFWNLSLASWSLIGFSLFFIFSVFQLKNLVKKIKNFY
ncbi:disulfide bond formation protein B [Gammaproteobacteria bacterium]|nr:disulfide bond formation protein B [Gammaproteobacteria bacterium]